MKKFLILLLLICAVSNINAQNTPTKAGKTTTKELRQTTNTATKSNKKQPKVETKTEKSKPAKEAALKAVKAEKPAKPVKATAPKAVKAEKPAKPVKATAPKAVKAEKPAKPAKATASKAVKAEKPAKPAKATAPKAVKAEKPAKSAKAAAPKAVKAEKPAKPVKATAPKAVKAEKSSKTTAVKAEKSAKAVKAEKSAKAVKSAKSAKSVAPKSVAPKAAKKDVAASEVQAKKVAEAKGSSEAKKSSKPRIQRVDRQINNNKFVFKSESMVGLTVSYGTLDSEDSNIGLFIDDIKLNGSMFTIKPHYGFFYRDNNAIGVRLGYTYANGSLDSAGLNLGESNDISLSIGGISYSNRGYSAAIYHRSYMAIDKKGRFGLFAEWELSGQMAQQQFDFTSGESVTSSVSQSYNVNLSFAPGVAVYIFPNVCASISFGMGGLQYKHIKQMDGAGNFTGTRDYSKLRFGLNLAQINIGVNVHLWKKKK